MPEFLPFQGQGYKLGPDWQVPVVIDVEAAEAAGEINTEDLDAIVAAQREFQQELDAAAEAPEDPEAPAEGAAPAAQPATWPAASSAAWPPAAEATTEGEVGDVSMVPAEDELDDPMREGWGTGMGFSRGWGHQSWQAGWDDAEWQSSSWHEAERDAITWDKSEWDKSEWDKSTEWDKYDNHDEEAALQADANEVGKKHAFLNRVMAGLEDAAKAGVKARSSEYQQFMRELTKGGKLKADYEKCDDRVEKDMFRRDWAARKAKIIQEKLQQTQVLKLVDWSKVTYLSLLQIYDLEKYWEVSKNIAKACTELGEPFIEWDAMGKVWRFAHQQKGTSEIFQRAWKVKQDLDCDDHDGGQTPNGKPPKRTAPASSKPPKEPRTDPSSEKKDVTAADKAIENTMTSYRTAMSSATNIVSAATGKTADSAKWKWLGEGNPKLKELQDSAASVKKAASTDFVNPMLTGIGPKDHKRSFDKASWIASVKSTTEKLDPVVAALQKKCEIITRMHHAQSQDD